jgi:ankyrin repeat protein
MFPHTILNSSRQNGADIQCYKTCYDKLCLGIINDEKKLCANCFDYNEILLKKKAQHRMGRRYQCRYPQAGVKLSIGSVESSSKCEQVTLVGGEGNKIVSESQLPNIIEIMGNKLIKELHQKSDDNVEQILEKFPLAAQVKGNYGFGDLPLLVALRIKASESVIQIIFKAYPEAAKVKGNYCEWLPLHYALRDRASDNTIYMILSAYPKATQIKGNDGCLPLHIALRYKASSNVIKRIFEEYKIAAKEPSKEGNLPLFEALASMTDNDTVKLIVKFYPGAVKVKSSSGKLPLHYVCHRRVYSSISVTAKVVLLDLFLTVYPESIGVRTDLGDLPSQILKQTNGEDNKQESLLIEALKMGHSTHLIKLLLEAFPESYLKQDENGIVPLHHACKSENPNYFENVIILLDFIINRSLVQDNDRKETLNLSAPRPVVPAPNLSHWPHVLSRSLDATDIGTYQTSNMTGHASLSLHFPLSKGDQEMISFYILSQRFSIADENGMFPLHHVAARSTNLSEISLSVLVSAYPKSIVSPDANGLLPFHHACLNPATTVELLLHFIWLFPDAIAFHAPKKLMKPKRFVIKRN